jgi:hypothetical protein
MDEDNDDNPINDLTYQEEELEFSELTLLGKGYKSINSSVALVDNRSYSI